MSERLAILIPTCLKYERLANATAEMISQFWKGHPAIYYCGLETNYPDRGNWLPLERNPSDWIGIAYDACVLLNDKGFDKVYLILDDHPPIGVCHPERLNNDLPLLMDDLHASCINLNGWSRYGRDGRKPSGDILPRRWYRLEKLPSDFLWRYSLHPALWELQSLIALLGAFLERYSVQERSPWLFERKANDVVKDIHLGNAYRVCGPCMTSRVLGNVRYVIHLLFLKLMRKFGNTQDYDDYAQYYDGPYPLYWSGVMQAGRENTQLMRFLRNNNRANQVAKLQEAVKVTVQNGET